MSKVPKLAGASDGCAKPGCTLRAPINRHHKAHEALWFGAWARRADEPQWRAFVKRYYEYREEDTARICLPHHAEIHSIYDAIIADDMARTGLPLYLYSWKQGKILMERLREACDAWLLLETPGIDSALYERRKHARRKILKKKAQKLYPATPSQEEEAALRRQKFKREKRRRKRP